MRELTAVVVRLERSEWWKDERGLRKDTRLHILRKQSGPIDWLISEIDKWGAAEFAKSIVNIDDCPSGVYRLVINQYHMDWTSGYMAYNWILEPLPLQDSVK